ncbi:hypothetical protein ACFVVX_11195 [Kitasatospora sp. NPDC058170]|uniref:hypothetical protein n=1 Tax=Kitasatospora sp. NPDC058170 TaxID=3346364 RepID=UPI0036DA16C7
MAASIDTRKIKTRDERRTERRRRAPDRTALVDHDAAYAAKAVGWGILREWPPCTCGKPECPDGAAGR